jgi:hypothetical protein
MDFLTGPTGVELLVRMVAGFVAAVAGIALWAHSREPSWILVIAATLLGYVEVLLRFLDSLGVTALDAWTWQGLPVVRLAFAGGIPLLYALGLWGAIRSYRKP